RYRDRALAEVDGRCLADDAECGLPAARNPERDRLARARAAERLAPDVLARRVEFREEGAEEPRVRKVVASEVDGSGEAARDHHVLVAVDGDGRAALLLRVAELRAVDLVEAIRVERREERVHVVGASRRSERRAPEARAARKHAG